MIPERMLELINLSLILQTVEVHELELADGVLETVTGDSVNVHMMEERYKELLREFISPYVINNNSKE